MGQDKLLRKDIIMKSTLYRKSISILKYLGLLVATILLFLGLNFWSNQLDDLHIQDVKIYNTFFAMENGKPTFYLYGKLKPTFASYSGGAFTQYNNSNGGNYGWNTSKNNVYIDGQQTHSPFGSKEVVFRIKSDSKEGLTLLNQNLYLTDHHHHKIKIYNAKTKTQPYSINQKDTQKFIKQNKLH
ncbi:hypothetical protein EFP35_10700 [Lactiplantibacillus pentosus]|uniref:hypothetical protein n=2 Tax=Lactobacillaceae TaxID=33958 RepID=UPI0020A6DF4E|nr:hypothetical protein [Lactiplantibacillus plantarum]MCT3290498.1 hypothetical protein [Lactiplantibacillus pentosus]MDN7032184.1 hypothetical protein [Lactiplantibacillus plantarum]